MILCGTGVYAIETALHSLTVAEKEWLHHHFTDIPLWFNDNFPPIEYADDEGNFTGMGADIIATVGKKLGITFAKTASSDWNAHLAALESGTCAVAPTIVQNRERDRYAWFTTAYASVPVVIISAQTFGTGISIEDLIDKRVAVVSGYATERYLRDVPGVSLNLITVADVPEGLRAVAFGQSDVFVGNLAVASYHISKQGISNLHVAGVTDYKFEFRIGVSKKYPLLFFSIQKAMHTLSPESLSTLQNRWITLKVQKGLSSKTVEQLQVTGVFVILLIVSLACISFFLKRRLNETEVYAGVNAGHH